MAFIKKTWKDRISAFPARRSILKEDGSMETVTVSREEGEISQEGDAFSAVNMNDLEERISTSINEVELKADEATNIAKGRNQAHVFATTEDMKSWLSNEENKDLWTRGDNIYIVELDVPDWWVADVLDEADPETGYYYSIAQLETQKVDLTNYLSLAGGTMTGVLTSQSIYPSVNSYYNCGSVTEPFAKMHSNKIYATGSDGQYYVQLTTSTEGTTDTQGLGDVWVGNSIAKGTAGNAKGRIILYNANSAYSVIQDNDTATASRSLTLPKVSGTIPVVSLSGTTLTISY